MLERSNLHNRLTAGFGEVEAKHAAIQAECAKQATDGCERQRPPYIATTVEVRATHTFPEAFAMMVERGVGITRAGWNRAGQSVRVQYPDPHSKMRAPYAYLDNGSHILTPWLPSQGDLFATDWAVLPS